MAASSITNDGYEYDVFLSFRGPDTRRDFTGNIWNALHNRGIRTFRDDLEINKGNNIEESLFEAIEKSKAAIVVLSPDYATSSFCLDELCHILKCIKGRGRFVWPIFYEVDPSIVRWSEKGTYGKAMAKHKASKFYSKDKLEEWKNALKQVANLSGTVYKWKSGHGYEYMFINEIVRDVSRVIQPFSLSIPDYLFGLEAQKQDVLMLLNVGSHDKVNMVGIHGIGGIGKTTLALAIYNSIVDQFDGSCYLEDVRRNAEKHGLIHLQNSLLSKIFGENQNAVSSYNEGIKELQVRLKQKKVLLLLDNVDKLDQLLAIVGETGWFRPGSRVIITTRDTQVLRSHGVESTYEMKELNKKDAWDFLRWKILKTNEVRPSHENVFNRALTYTSGHPLAIEIMGSYLFSKKEEEWNSVLDRYERIPKKEIFDNLKVSFDALVQEEKDVFLDIACFFKGYDLERVEAILHAHYGHEKEDHINVLIEKSLIKISESNVLTLHDMIEEMGKEIVRLESPNHPGERSRLWSVKDIVEVLEENTGTSKIGIIMCSESEDSIEVNWDGEAFKNMTNLRTLVIYHVYFSERPKYLPNSLRVLEWSRYPSECFPVDFFPRQLTRCKLLCAFDLSLEVFFKKNFKNMRILEFYHCNSLRSIDMSGLQNLEDFSCWWCNDLITFDDSIGIGFLGKLKTLSVVSCPKIENIPPFKLVSLEELYLSTLHSIKSLSPMLNESLGKLKILSVNDCPKIETIPLFKLVSLEELHLERLSSIESLSATLDGSLDKLKILSVHDCPKIETIPPLKLASLEELGLKGLSGIESLSATLDEPLDKLKILKVKRCEYLIYIPLLKLASLEKLILSRLSSIESLSPMLDKSLDKLKIVKVNGCSCLRYIPPLKLTSLEKLDLSDLNSITSLSPMLDEALDKLKFLSVHNCPKIETIPPLKLASLEELRLEGLTSIVSLSATLDESLDMLKILKVDCCAKLQTIPSLKFASLEELYLSRLDSITSLSPMLGESLVKLKILNVDYCAKLQTIPSLKLASLEELILGGLSSIKSLSPMLDESLDKLKILTVYHCSDLIYIPLLKLPSLEELDLSGLPIKSLSPMLNESLDKLKILKVFGCSDLIYIPLLKLPSLEELDLSYLDSIKSLSPMLDGSLDKLKILKVDCCAKLQTIPSLKLASLEELCLSNLHSIKSLSSLLDESLDKLKVLNIEGCYKLISFPAVMLPSLETLDLSYCYCLENFPPIMLPSLEILDLSYCECLETFPPMVSGSMAKLKILRLKGCKKLKNIPAINVDSLDEYDDGSGCESFEFSPLD